MVAGLRTDLGLPLGPDAAFFFLVIRRNLLFQLWMMKDGGCEFEFDVGRFKAIKTVINSLVRDTLVTARERQRWADKHEGGV